MNSIIPFVSLKSMMNHGQRCIRDWFSCYGEAVLMPGMVALPYAIEIFYPQTPITEWEMGVVRMILFNNQYAEPLACLSIDVFCDRFHLGGRQIQRKLKVMENKGLLKITPYYSEDGKKTPYKLYDCYPFLKLIADLVIQDMKRHKELAKQKVQLAAEHALSNVSNMTEMSGATSPSTMTEMSGATEMSHPNGIPIITEMSPATYPPLSGATNLSPVTEMSAATHLSQQNGSFNVTEMSAATHLSQQNGSFNVTEMSAAIHLSTGGSVSNQVPCELEQRIPELATLSRTEMSQIAADGNEYSKNSNSNIINNTSIINNIYTSNSNNTNKKKLKENDGYECIPAVCPEGSIATNQCVEDNAPETSSMFDKKQASFEQWVQDAVEQANAESEQAEQVTASSQSGQQAKAVREASPRIEQMLEIESSNEQPAKICKMGSLAETALQRISRDLNDVWPRSSLTQANKLYQQLMQINQVEDRHTLSDPDQFFADMMELICVKLSGIKIMRVNAHGQSNGMPLFFKTLRQEVESEVQRVQDMREKVERTTAASERYHARQARTWGPDSLGAKMASEHHISLTESHAISQEIAAIPLSPEQILSEGRRLNVEYLEDYADAMLDGTIKPYQREMIESGVRLSLYYEKLDGYAYKAGY
ncbi:hypothetical protein [Dictyobacter arantiisoli]|uniref:Uncharacterized protein n=1 Tax=Dictyobacter arantiisoli TaxID=2014874 RepID=A0A5A5TID3_9CHLR|nr:hypothetical protein [Dictyobacter arantiisoli]GCF10958.1 hypothetical protein KDI_45220 [Dictyobacter arantiisoli]